DETKEAVTEQTGGGQAEEVRAVASVREFLQRAVEADRVVRVVLDSSFRDADPDHRESDGPCDMTGNPDAATPRPLGPAHSAPAPPVLELPRDAAIQVPET